MIRIIKEILKPKTLFWTSEVYGRGKLYREYGYYPKILPLNIYSQHGIYHCEIPYKHELECEAPVILFFTETLVRNYRTLKNTSKRDAYKIVDPFVFYRRRRKVKPQSNSKGTLVFAAHSTDNVSNISDVNIFIDDLDRLPEVFRPITICLHYYDILKNEHLKFQSRGYSTISVGHPSDSNFTKKFYDLLRKFKYTSSNYIGSYAYYSIEMGIPFFLYGAKPVYMNLLDPNYSNDLDINNEVNLLKYKEAVSLFAYNDEIPSISKSQMQHVEELLGIKNSISRLRFSCILYKSYILYLIGKHLRHR
jgi:hypothetical protein